jgi:uncharacterized protein YceH (UPF0502 family)
VDLDPVEVRVIGCLLEKQRTTPDAYPLSLNALRLACNQSTARDPVVSYEEPEIREALNKLGRRRWTRLASGHGSRAAKFRHLLDDTLGLSREEQAVLAVLALRGPQTSGELRSRTERLFHFGTAEDVEAVLARLADRDLTVRLARRPGQKEERFAHLLSGDADELPVAAGPAPVAAAPADDRVERLEREVATLKAQVAELRAELGLA